MADVEAETIILQGTFAARPAAAAALVYYVTTGASAGKRYWSDGASWFEQPPEASYAPGGTDVAVTDGGTGASSASAARTNLGLVIGTDVPGQAAFDDHSARHEAGGADALAIDAAAATGSLRTLGTGATQAAVGSHAHAFVGCRITEATAQSLTDNTLTALTSNDAEVYDVGGFHDTVTNNTRLTAPVARYYAIGGWIFFAGNATGYREIQIRLNGTTILAYNRMLNNTATGLGITTETQYFLGVGDYVELCGLQNSGGALNAFMSGFWIGSLGT